MKRYLLIAVAALYAAFAGFTSTQAAPTWSNNEVVMQLGTSSNDMVIAPAELDFQAGKSYKLIITNPSKVTHLLSMPEFGQAVLTAEVDVYGDKVTRSAYRVHPGYKIEVQPGETAEWRFEPVTMGSYWVMCGIPTHAKAGMTAKIVVR